jgi:hypothetical protein
MSKIKCMAVLLPVFLLATCDDSDRRDIAGPTAPALSAVAGEDGALPRFPPLIAHIPPVRIADGPDPRPELTDHELEAEVARADGRVIIGFKPPAALRTRETGVVPGMDRASALAGRAAVEAMGAEITLSFRYSSAVAATIPPGLAPALRTLPMVDYVEPSFPGKVLQANPPQDTTWGIKKIRAHTVWSGIGDQSNRGYGAYITILDSGLDSIHRWSPVGDGPANVGVRCYFVAGTGNNCYGRGHGAHVAGIIAAGNNAYGYIGIAHEPWAFASIKVCFETGKNCAPEWIASGLDWVLGVVHPRRVVNLSVGTCEHYTLLEQKVAMAAAAGVLLIGAAGNTDSCPGKSGVLWPAKYPGVMAVSGTLANDEFAEPMSVPSPPRGGPGSPEEECDPNLGCNERQSCSGGVRIRPRGGNRRAVLGREHVAVRGVRPHVWNVRIGPDGFRRRGPGMDPQSHLVRAAGSGSAQGDGYSLQPGEQIWSRPSGRLQRRLCPAAATSAAAPGPDQRSDQRATWGDVFLDGDVERGATTELRMASEWQSGGHQQFHLRPHCGVDDIRLERDRDRRHG